MSDLFKLAIPWYELILRSVGIYFVLFIGLRLFGKREVGQFTIFDLVFILLVANAVQPAMTGPDSSLGGGIVIIGSLLVANLLVGRLDKIELFHRLFTIAPTVLVKDGAYQKAGMDKEGIEADEVQMAMREHGIAKLSEVTLAMLESDGSISIIGKDGQTYRRRRRSRFVRGGG
ncbi:MAG: hypothetical protein NVS9B1_05360 [Candidatus Dormibacteraceae bacterium]